MGGTYIAPNILPVGAGAGRSVPGADVPGTRVDSLNPGIRIDGIDRDRGRRSAHHRRGRRGGCITRSSVDGGRNVGGHNVDGNSVGGRDVGRHSVGGLADSGSREGDHNPTVALCLVLAALTILLGIALSHQDVVGIVEASVGGLVDGCHHLPLGIRAVRNLLALRLLKGIQDLLVELLLRQLGLPVATPAQVLLHGHVQRDVLLLLVDNVPVVVVAEEHGVLLHPHQLNRLDINPTIRVRLGKFNAVESKSVEHIDAGDAALEQDVSENLVPRSAGTFTNLRSFYCAAGSW
jgi:hypothetical protein